MGRTSARLIAYYLPQYHPIPENDAFWGAGFTEWTNVAKARPLYPGHYQPHLPAELGFYDLRVPETRAAQAELAAAHGIEGFCYWHYWFAGRRLLQRPFEEVLRSGEPKYPFCLAWANESWTGVWHGSPGNVLVEQTYPGDQDHEAHFLTLLDAFGDDRYMKVGGLPLFVVYRPTGITDPIRFCDLWREMAVRSGLGGLYMLGISSPGWSPGDYGFDGSIASSGDVFGQLRQPRLPTRLLRNVSRSIRRHTAPLRLGPEVYSYQDALRHTLPPLEACPSRYPCVLSNWDNTPRSGRRGVVLHGSTPDLFKNHLQAALRQVRAREVDRRLVFVKSWNEWAEGNHLEPDQRLGRGYLHVIAESVLD